MIKKVRIPKMNPVPKRLKNSYTKRTGLKSSKQSTADGTIIIPETSYGPAIVENKPIPLDKVVKQLKAEK
jgi:hypothetical protein